MSCVQELRPHVHLLGHDGHHLCLHIGYRMAFGRFHGRSMEGVNGDSAPILVGLLSEGLERAACRGVQVRCE